MTLTLDAVSQALREIVAEVPADYTYESPLDEECVYSTFGGAPSCLVGQVLYRLAPEFFSEVHSREWESGQSAPYVQSVEFLPWAEGGIEGIALLLLTAVQVQQDQGTPWSLAVESSEQDLILWLEEE